MEWDTIVTVTGPPVVLFSSAAGGLTRWLALSETWREGLASVAVGVLAGRFLWRLVEPALTVVLMRLDLSHMSKEAAGYIAGALGLSVFKVAYKFLSRLEKED